MKTMLLATLFIVFSFSVTMAQEECPPISQAYATLQVSESTYLLIHDRENKFELLYREGKTETTFSVVPFSACGGGLTITLSKTIRTGKQGRQTNGLVIQYIGGITGQGVTEAKVFSTVFPNPPEPDSEGRRHPVDPIYWAKPVLVGPIQERFIFSVVEGLNEFIVKWKNKQPIEKHGGPDCKYPGPFVEMSPILRKNIAVLMKTPISEFYKMIERCGTK